MSVEETINLRPLFVQAREPYIIRNNVYYAGPLFYYIIYYTRFRNDLQRYIYIHPTVTSRDDLYIIYLYGILCSPENTRTI